MRLARGGGRGQCCVGTTLSADDAPARDLDPHTGGNHDRPRHARPERLWKRCEAIRDSRRSEPECRLPDEPIGSGIARGVDPVARAAQAAATPVCRRRDRRDARRREPSGPFSGTVTRPAQARDVGPLSGPRRCLPDRYPDAAPERAAEPFPLVIFAHGFAVTPAPYRRLLETWSRAGYVVAAPIFPLENANAPGGPNESDLINQPRDMSFVITRLLQASADRHSWLAGLIDPRRVAVSGQSDGGETALAVAYDRRFIDRRVKAAIILSGARIPGIGGFDFPTPSPPLLATQGTADTINPPSSTLAFYDIAPPPDGKLVGGCHLPKHC
jgi:dienelactone hydrolase